MWERVQSWIVKNYQTILLIVALISIIPFFAISIYSRPSLDDFSNSLALHRLMSTGDWNITSLISCAWTENMRYYHVWNGLYSSQFLVQFQTGVFGEKYYFIGVIVLLVFGWTSFYFLIKELDSLFKLKCKPFLIATVIFAYMLQGLPSTVQGIYWIAGACPYMGFLYLTIINIALVIRYFREKKIRCLVAITILSFVISGGPHVSSFLNILMLITFVIIGWFYQRRQLIIPLISASVGFVIMCIAPGTTARQNALNRQSVASTLLHSIWGGYTYTCWWLNIQWISAAIIMVVVVRTYIKRLPEFKVRPLFVVIYSFGVICALFCVPYLPLGNYGPTRLQNVIWVSFTLLSWVSCLYGIIYHLQKRQTDIGFNKGTCLVVICICCCIGLFYRDANGLSITKELLNGTAKSYAVQCDDRFGKMRHLSGEKTMKFRPLVDSKHLKMGDISKDTSRWENDAWSQYYGVLPILDE